MVRWAEVRVDLERIKAAFEEQYPAPRYRVSVKRYPAEACFSFRSRPHTLHVVSGRLRIGELGVFEGGQSVGVGAGDWTVRVLEEVVLCSVWDLRQLRSS